MIDAPASRRTVSRYIAAESVADVCEFVDELDHAAVGELVIADAGVMGTVFIEGGRICWAAAEGLARRLTELLVSRAGVDASTMEGFYRTCKAERRPLGEYLVSMGIVSAQDLRLALAQHTVESLFQLVAAGRRGAWYPRSRGGHSPRFTFGTAEVLARANATRDDERARRADDEMEACFGSGDWAAAFVRTPARAVPQPIALCGEAPSAARALARIAKWAVSALDVVAAFDAEDPVIAVTLPASHAAPDGPASTTQQTSQRRGQVLVAFRCEGVVIAGESSAQCPARVLNRRARMRATRG